jgi:hypothetical protein
MKLTTILAATAAPLALGAVLLGTAGQASAATVKTVTANTHLNDHPDTTGLYNVGAIGTDNVWAHDNATEKFTIVQTGDNAYSVTMDYVGSFHGFADPRTAADGGDPANLGAALDSNGSVKGTIAYDVTVAPGQLPDPSALPGQSPSDAHIGDNINKLFDGNVTSISQAPSGYLFTYHTVAGADYIQRG